MIQTFLHQVHEHNFYYYDDYLVDLTKNKIIK
jgi:hypothetical protein